jgi:hypothetical protein
VLIRLDNIDPINKKYVFFDRSKEFTLYLIFLLKINKMLTNTDVLEKELEKLNAREVR